MVDRTRAVAEACTRHLYAHGRSTPAQTLEALQDEASRGVDADRYGDGGVVSEVEEQVRELLGTEAAVLLPSGVMAQGIALRLHAEQRGRRVVTMHPSSHPVVHEEDALTAAHGLDVRAVGDPHALVTADDLLGVDGVGAVLVELPQRETGGQLVPFDDLAELSQRCHDRDVALHLDGARLWECGPAYDRPLADVVGLADTAYVSLYKGLGATAGAVLVGPADHVAAARVWRRRLGGTLPSLWPLALGARRGMREHLPRMPEYVAHAQALAAALADVVEVVAPPATTLFHVVLPGSPDDVQEALLDVSEESGVFLRHGGPGPREGTTQVELYAGAATLEVSPDEVAELFGRVISHLTASPTA
ncbi:aminotransferase class I/II-fold pyridoxal phosphate-dependent enzyme [Angustibacter peucedani]